MRRGLVPAAALVFGLVAGGIAVISAAPPDPAPTSDVVQFPACFEHDIAVGTVVVYNHPPAGSCGADSSSTTEVTSSSTSSTTTAPESATTTEAPSTSSTTSPSTSAPPTTAGTTTTTSPTTSSTAPAATSTTAATTSSTSSSMAPTTTGSPVSPGCGLAAAAFCETFDSPHPDSTSRTGDLDQELWGVSRAHSQGNTSGDRFQWYKAVGYTNGLTTPVPGCTIGVAPNDVRICNGRLIEATNDHGNDAKTTLAMYPKQPFNFAGRTGNIVFDVSEDSTSAHAAWPELWVTDKPVPAPGVDEHSSPQNAIGIVFNSVNGCFAGARIITVINYVPTERFNADQSQCFKLTTPSHATSAQLNHVHVQISSTLISVFMTNPGSTTEVKLASLANPGLDPGFTQGLVWLNDVHYNACKFDQECDHAFAWDNFGFDGPKTYRDLSFDVLDAMTARSDGGVNLGYPLTAAGHDFTVQGVHHGDKTPTGAYVLLNQYTQDTQEVPSVSVNGGPLIATPWKWGSTVAYNIETIAIPIDPALVHDGVNTIHMVSRSAMTVGNINLVLVNAQSVP